MGSDCYISDWHREEWGLGDCYYYFRSGHNKFEMNSEQSSFREIYEYPSRDAKPGKNRTRHIKKRSMGEEPIKVESFDKFVRKTKNVIMFAQKLKQQIAQKRIFNMHNLTSKEMEYLQNEPSDPGETTFFSCDNHIVLVFQALFVFLLLFFAWKNCIEAVFTLSSQLAVVNFATLGAYCLEVLLFCLSEYKNERQQIITDRRSVWQIYLHEHCLKDFIAIVLIVLQSVEVAERLDTYALFLLLRIGSTYLTFDRMLELVSKLENRLAVSTNAETMIAMIKLLFKIFMFLHFLSIFLNLMAELEVEFGQYDTWISQHSHSLNGDYDRYIVGWYWGATILSTVGFGDISPNNNLERFFISIVQVFCCMAFGYFVNVIGSLLRLRTERDEKYEKETRTLNRYLSSLTLSQDLKFKVRNHFFNKHKIDKTYDSGEEKVVLSNLTPPLKCSLLEQNNINILKKSSYLQKFSHQTLMKVALLLKRVIFAPEHVIYSRDTEQQKLWFIESGAVQEFTDAFEGSTNTKKIAHYQKEDLTIGWIRFLTQSRYTTQAKSCQFTVAYEMEYNKFMATLHESPKEWHKLLGIKHLLIESKKKYLQKCLSCDRYSHNVMECPRIHYIHRNVVSMVKQEKNFEAYRASHRHKRKFNRESMRDNWKNSFQGAGNLGKANVFQTKHEENRLNETIDHFIRNLTKIQSLKQISNKRISAINNSKAERDSKVSEWQPKDLYLIPHEKSIGSMEISDVVEVEEIEFEKVLLDKENKEYLPQHHVDQIISRYNQLSCKKQTKGFPHLFQFRKL